MCLTLMQYIPTTCRFTKKKMKERRKTRFFNANEYECRVYISTRIERYIRVSRIYLRNKDSTFSYNQKKKKKMVYNIQKKNCNLHNLNNFENVTRIISHSIFHDTECFSIVSK